MIRLGSSAIILVAILFCVFANAEIEPSRQAEQTDLILKLEDDYRAPKARELLWTFGFFLQQHSPQGSINAASAQQNIGDSGKTFLPSVSLGALYNFSHDKSSSHGGVWQWGLEAEAGFSSQKVSLKSGNGSDIEARLNTTLMEFRTLARWGASFESPLYFRLGVGRGRLNYTLSSDNSLARGSESGIYNAFLAGADYKIAPQWQLLAQGKLISPLSDWPTSIDAPSSQLELGVQVEW